MAIITISREYGCEGRKIGKLLADSLGYSYIDKQAILDATKKQGSVWAKWEREIGESSPSLWERFDRSFIGLVALEEKAIFDAALSEKSVIVGRGANWLLKDVPFALHVRLIAPIETRVANIVKRDDISEDQALHFIKRADLDRSRYIRTVYGQDWADQLSYDVVFDNGRLSVEEVVKLISDLVPDKDRLITEAERKKLRQLAMVADVRVAVLTAPEVFIPTLEVYHDGKSLIITGIVKHAAERKHAEDIARSIVGDEPFISKLHYRF